MPVLYGWSDARHWLVLTCICILSFGLSLGSSSRLTYHEAIWAESAREMIVGNHFIIPTVNEEPWLEKPPLATWLIAIASLVASDVNPAAARFPSTIAAFGVVAAVSVLATRHFGSTVGFIAGAVQATTIWTVTRGRLAEADIILACLTSWALVAFDGMNFGRPNQRWWRLAFFILLGTTALVKGVGFGAALVVATVGGVLLWNRDKTGWCALLSPVGWLLAILIGLSWPLAVLVQYPRAIDLWILHITDRLSRQPHEFIGESYWAYGASWLWQSLPWTPFAIRGAWESLRIRGEIRDVGLRSSIHHLLWAWAFIPAALVSLASVRNAHYLIYSLPPWSIWAAIRIHQRMEQMLAEGWSPKQLGRILTTVFLGLGLVYGVGFSIVGPYIDRRGQEWAFYEGIGQLLRPDETVTLLYDDWDRRPYSNSVAAPLPHDLPIRRYYLRRPVCWYKRVSELEKKLVGQSDINLAIIARERDLPELRRLGGVKILAHGPTERRDRAFLLIRFRPEHRGPWLSRSLKGQDRVELR